jgi:pimeloyl-ACP methyl ester carboxylesterase
MPHANNQGVRIHYQVIGQGPPLVLLHWFSGDIMHWHELGYVEKLQNEHRLILVDARGHGASDKPHELDDYALDRMLSDVTAVLDDLHIEKANYVGYSMGGWIGFGMARYAAHRLNSLVIGGAHPYETDNEQVRELLRVGLEAWLATIENRGIYSPAALARMRKNDAKALLAVMQDRPDISNILPGMTMPCLLYAGSGDNRHELVERCAKEIANAAFVTLPGLDHLQVILRSDIVVPHVNQFLSAA